MIILKDIEFKYPKKKMFSLAQISFSVKPGEIFTLLGPNGAGKTTLIRIFSGLILPRRGSVSICGYDIRGDEYNARKSIGLVMGDERTFYFRLTALQNLEFFGGLYGIRRSILREKVRYLLGLVGLQDDANLQFMRFSTGMKKRLNMARALLHDPPVLLLDEPNGGVDPHSARTIRETILSLKAENKTILLTTHDMGEAERLSDTIGFLKEGRLIKVGKVADYKELIGNKTLEIVFDRVRIPEDSSVISDLMEKIKPALPQGDIDFDNGILRISYNGSFDISKIFNIVLQQGMAIARADTIEASLEDVFIKLAG
jgi:ABC-2 type transport system ATP-binding protein